MLLDTNGPLVVLLWCIAWSRHIWIVLHPPIYLEVVGVTEPALGIGELDNCLGPQKFVKKLHIKRAPFQNPIPTKRPLKCDVALGLVLHRASWSRPSG